MARLVYEKTFTCDYNFFINTELRKQRKLIIVLNMERTFRCRKFKARIELPRLVFESVSATHRCKNECEKQMSELAACGKLNASHLF